MEIGPGTGCLTELILKNPNKLIVVEKDEKLSNLLSEKYKNKLEIINKDILDCYKEFRFNNQLKFSEICHTTYQQKFYYHLLN